MAREKIDGLDGVLKNLRQLEGKNSKKIVRHSLRAGAKPLRNDMKRRAKALDDPSTEEKIWKQIGTRAMKKKELKNSSFDFGVSTGVKNAKPGEPYRYALFIELGTVNQRPMPFIRPAADATKGEVFRAVTADLWDGIKKQVTKGG